jgi:hypothetical protein
LAVVVAVAAPPRLTVAPFPPDPLMVPLMVKVWVVVVKVGAVALLPLTITFWLVGAKENPVLTGVSV